MISCRWIRESADFRCIACLGRRQVILLLCSRVMVCFYVVLSLISITVYNPTTNLFKMLPQCEDLSFEWLYSYSGMRLAFDPTNSPYYKVVQIAGVHDDVYGCRGQLRLHTYSSETGIWSVSREQRQLVICGTFNKGIYWNDAIYAIEVVGSPFHRKFSIEEYSKEDITVTPLKFDKEVRDNCKLFESCGCLYFVGTNTQHLPIYEMRNGDSEWSLKYVVNLDDVMKLLHENHMMLSKWDCSRIWSIVSGEREEDSFLVMELFGKVVQYNIVLKSLREVCELKSISPPDMDPTKLDKFQFIASSASV